MIRQNKAIVLMPDFGTSDGCVSELYGVIDSVNPALKVHDLSHHIPPFAVRTAAYRLFQVFSYWAPGTVFVCAIDPDVGTDQHAILAQSNTGHYFVAPNNGVLTFIDAFYGLSKVIGLDKEKALHPLAKSHTSYGRDVYAYVAAQWASGVIDSDHMGVPYEHALFRLPLIGPKDDVNGVMGAIEIEDSYGNAWTNIDVDCLNRNSVTEGKKYQVHISDDNGTLFHQDVFFGRTYACVEKNEPVLYINSMHCLAIGIHQGNFYKKHQLSWRDFPAMIHIKSIKI